MNIGFVNSVYKYVKVRMNKLLQTHRFPGIYDHIIHVLVINKGLLNMGTINKLEPR